MAIFNDFEEKKEGEVEEGSENSVLEEADETSGFVIKPEQKEEEAETETEPVSTPEPETTPGPEPVTKRDP